MSAERIKVKITCACMSKEVSPRWNAEFDSDEYQRKSKGSQRVPIFKINPHGKPSGLIKKINGQTIALQRRQVKNVGGSSCSSTFVIRRYELVCRCLSARSIKFFGVDRRKFIPQIAEMRTA